MTDVLVVGAGPAGAMASLRAATLGARTTLVTSGAFGGMAGTDGPVPVRALAHAARLMREARQLGDYGVTVGDPRLDYPALLRRVAGVVQETGRRSTLRAQVDAAGVTLCEGAGPVRFVDPHALETTDGRRFTADKVILCTGGVSRKLPIPGFNLTATHSDAWSLAAVPESMLVVGSGATGAQVASVFNAFGSRVHLFEAGPRILGTEEPEVSACVAGAFRDSGIVVHEAFGAIESFAKTADGVRMTYSRDGLSRHVDAALAVVAVGWTADTAALNLGAAGVATTDRGFVSVDERLCTSAAHIFAAGDVTGRRMLAPQALQAGFAAATNALDGPAETGAHEINPVGSFTDPEYAQVGLGEAGARLAHDVEVVVVGYDEATRPIIDGRAAGFCKLIVDRSSHAILGCHIVGERAVDVVQVAAVAMAGGLKVGQMARMPLSFPTYAGVLGRAAAVAASTFGGAARRPGAEIGGLS